MKKTLKLVTKYEARNMVTISTVIHQDGSGFILDFWTQKEIAHFDTRAELHEILKK
jgi:hypothetical protein